jgi:predicted secreted protein
MGSCNTTTNERSGKDLLLKICEEKDFTVAIGTSDDATAILMPSHGLQVGDVVRALQLGTFDGISAALLYFVVAIPSSGSFRISHVPGGTPITFTTAATDSSLEVFKTVGGLRSSGISFSSEGVETTNHGSNQWRQLKDGAGILSASVSGDGVYTTVANFRTMEANFLLNRNQCLAFTDVSAGRVYYGCFKITSLEHSGEYAGEATYTMSAESAGQVTVFQGTVPE